VAFLVFLIPVSIALFRSETHGGSVRGLRFSIASLWIAVGFGILVASGHGWEAIPLMRKFTALHIAWAAVGWITIMIISIAYQVIPMFQITVDYPRILHRYLTGIIFIILIAWSLTYYSGFSKESELTWLLILIACTVTLLLAVFVVITLMMQIQRKKRMADATLYFWIIGLICLFLSLALHCYSNIVDINLDLLIGIIFFVGFAISIINGMLYKIVPFLVWLHLHRKLAFKTEKRSAIPTMNDVISSKKSLLQLYIHILALLLSIAASFSPENFLYVAAICWLINWCILLVHLIQAIVLYRSCLTSK
ncbi:MAG: hypothetical protein OEZ38_14570, partial [Gammaproteobacteria bacterium]|nr:hypothetical protein [Gammaproteobacteria bacterium]